MQSRAHTDRRLRAGWWKYIKLVSDGLCTPLVYAYMVTWAAMATDRNSLDTCHRVKYITGITICAGHRWRLAKIVVHRAPSA